MDLFVPTNTVLDSFWFKKQHFIPAEYENMD